MTDLIDRRALDLEFTKLRFNKDRTLRHWGDRPEWCLYGQEVEELINSAQSVDAVPVVYCKDCIHWDERKGEKYCEEMYFNQDDPKFYCGYAERRENATD